MAEPEAKDLKVRRLYDEQVRVATADQQNHQGSTIGLQNDPEDANEAEALPNEPGANNADSSPATSDNTDMDFEKCDSYTFDGKHGWRKYRVLQPGRGIFHDVRRRLPFYRSDITDALTYRVIASTIRMYFVKYVP